MNFIRGVFLMIKILYIAWFEYQLSFEKKSIITKGMMTSSNQMEIFSAFVRGIHQFPLQRPKTRSFGVFFDLRLNKRMSKQLRCRLFETPSRRTRGSGTEARLVGGVEGLLMKNWLGSDGLGGRGKKIQIFGRCVPEKKNRGKKGEGRKNWVGVY